MKINGYWFGAGLIGFTDYIWYNFKSYNYSRFFPIISAILVIIFFGLAFKEGETKIKTSHKGSEVGR